MTGTGFMGTGEDGIDDAKSAARMNTLGCQAIAGVNLAAGISRVFKGPHHGCPNGHDASTGGTGAENGVGRKMGR